MKDATMQDNQSVAHEAAVAGQKYAFATASLVLALLCFVNVAILEKAVVAILFGLQALRREPPPALVHRRTWAKAGVALGMIFLTVIPVLVWFVVGVDGLRQLFDALARLGAAK
jgi:hypothetical protein